jgi:sialidase-1
MPSIEVLESLLVYENPRPHVRSRHGYFPGLVRLFSGDLLALFVIAEAFEAADATTWVARSTDGRVWTLERPLYDRTALARPASDYLKATALRDGRLIAIGYRFFRPDPEEPIGIAETGGILAGEDVVSFSGDEGRSWTWPTPIPRHCPELLEISGPCVELCTGDIVAAAALYPLPDGSTPSGHDGVLVRSSDGGRTWDTSHPYYRHNGLAISPYEPRLVEMQPGRLVAIVWAYHAAGGRHLPNHVTVSHDGGHTWSAPIDTGHPGQASNLLWLGDDLLFTIHAQRGEDPGIWVRLVDFRGDCWRPLAEAVIYGREHGAQTIAGQPAPEMFRSLRFGQPSLLRLDAGEVLAAHWAIEDGQGRIRAHRLRVAF